MGLTGLLLGAGASFDLGMPLVWELTEEIKAWLTPERLYSLNRQWQSRGHGYSDAAINTLAEVLEREDMHYEHILGLLEVQYRRGQTNSQDYHGLYSFLVEIVYVLLQQRHILNIAFIEQNIRYLEGITALAQENEPLWIFSLNYDLIVECLAANAGIPLKSGFMEEITRLPKRDLNGIVIGYLEAHVLPREVLENQALPFFNAGEEGINLLKMHGSLDVFAFRDGRDLLKIVSSDDGVRGVLTSLRSANEDLRYVEPAWPGGVVRVPNEIVYQDDVGEMQFLRRTLLAGAYKFQNSHGQVVPEKLLLHFVSNLNYLTTLLCIGYGFGDHHINQVIRGWLEFARKRRLIIVDPERQSIPSAFLHLAPQVDLIALDCTDYLDQVGGIERSEPEMLRRRFGACMRKNRGEADTKLEEFLRQVTMQQVDRFVEWVKTLPFRDGDVDLEQLGLTVEEVVRAGAEQLALPSPEEMLEEFLRKATD